MGGSKMSGAEKMKQLPLSADIPQVKPIIKHKSKYKKWQYEANYRKSETPILRSCQNCNNCVGFTNGHRNWYKCNLQGISHSQATDITLKSVCDYWQQEYQNCQLCKHLGCTSDGTFICSIDDEEIRNESEAIGGCIEFKKYLERI
jgi:hypothetical protein